MPKALKRCLCALNFVPNVKFSTNLSNFLKLHLLYCQNLFPLAPTNRRFTEKIGLVGTLLYDNLGVAVNLIWLPIRAHLLSNDFFERFNHAEGVKSEMLINMALVYPFYSPWHGDDSCKSDLKKYRLCTFALNM